MESGYGFDSDRFRLGALCKRGHNWNSTGQSLRRNKRKGACLECEKISIAARFSTPEKVARHKEYRRKYMAAERLRLGTTKQRLKLLEQGLTTRGTERINGTPATGLQKAIRAAGRCPSVARLVINEQRRYWRSNPEAKAEHDRQWAQASWWLEYQIKPDLRLYHREKSKRRKAQNRGQTPVQIPVAALRQRFNEFGNCCAYCGDGGNMQIEHLEPISKGGAHDIGNIVPACASCNTSKRSHPMETWYRSQPFFSEIRLHRIRRVIRPPAGHQLALALA